MFNQIILAGRVSSKPQMVQIENYKKCVFNMAVQRAYRNKENGEYTTDFFRITCWAGLSERVVNNLKVGNVIIVKGRIEPNNYTNKDGQNVYETVIVAEKAIFMNAKEKIAEASDEETDSKEE